MNVIILTTAIWKQYWPYGDASLSLTKIHIGYKNRIKPYFQQETLYDERFFEMAGYRLAQCCWSASIWTTPTTGNKNEKSASTLTTFCGVSGGFEDAMRQERSLYADFLANIDKTFGDFHLTANVGASIYHTSMDQLYIAGDLVIPNFFQINNINFSANYKPDPTGYEDEIQSILPVLN